MKSGHFRTYSQPEASFWCCVGTGMENHTKYAQSIYCHDADSLYVNLFIPSELKWNGLTVRQETDYPVSGKINLRLTGTSQNEFAIKLRYPAWARGTD